MTTPTPEQLTITPHFIEQMKLAVKNPTIEGRCPVSPAELTALIAAAERCERMEKCLRWLDMHGGLGLDKHEAIRAAVAHPATFPVQQEPPKDASDETSFTDDERQLVQWLGLSQFEIAYKPDQIGRLPALIELVRRIKTHFMVRCDKCGSRPTDPFPACSPWRWSGECWQHRCADAHPQVGHWDVKP